MPVYWLPITIEKQLEAIQALLQVRFLSYNEKKELERITKDLKYRIPLNYSEKDFLQRIISKHGYLVK